MNKEQKEKLNERFAIIMKAEDVNFEEEFEKALQLAYLCGANEMERIMDDGFYNQDNYKSRVILDVNLDTGEYNCHGLSILQAEQIIEQIKKIREQ